MVEIDKRIIGNKTFKLFWNNTNSATVIAYDSNNKVIGQKTFDNCFDSQCYWNAVKNSAANNTKEIKFA